MAIICFSEAITQQSDLISELFLNFYIGRCFFLFFCSLEGDDIGVLQFPKMFDIGFFYISDFLHSHFFAMKLPQEDSSLSSTAYPL